MVECNDDLCSVFRLKVATTTFIKREVRFYSDAIPVAVKTVCSIRNPLAAHHCSHGKVKEGVEPEDLPDAI
ncbi:MAG: hypothetical protein RIR84_710 [Bacteroidota bacterium]|jgi:hypothetical protein